MNPKILALLALLGPLLADAQTTAPASAPLSYQIVPNVQYAVSDPSQVADVYLPIDNATTPRPVVFMFHGGCFTGGSKSEMAGEAAAFAQDGVVVVNVEYRRKAAYPASWQDAMAVVRHIRANAATYNIDPLKQASYGHSAGSTLAMLLGVKPIFNEAWAQDALSYRMSAVMDGHGRIDFMHRDPALDPATPDCAEQWLQKRRVDYPADFAKASPLAYVDQWTPKVIIQHNQQDTTVLPYHGEALHQKLWSLRRQSIFVSEAGGHAVTTSEKPIIRKLVERELGVMR